MIEFDDKDRWHLYRKKGETPVTAWQEGDDMEGVSVSDEDKAAGSPKPGDVIAVNPSNPRDQWLISYAYFTDHYVPA